MTTDSPPDFPFITVQLTGTDGNVFAIIAKVSTALRRAGYSDSANEFRVTAMACQSYDAVLQLVMETVEVA